MGGFGCAFERPYSMLLLNGIFLYSFISIAKLVNKVKVHKNFSKNKHFALIKENVVFKHRGMAADKLIKL